MSCQELLHCFHRDRVVALLIRLILAWQGDNIFTTRKPLDLQRHSNVEWLCTSMVAGARGGVYSWVCNILSLIWSCFLAYGRWGKQASNILPNTCQLAFWELVHGNLSHLLTTVSLSYSSLIIGCPTLGTSFAFKNRTAEDAQAESQNRRESTSQWRVNVIKVINSSLLQCAPSIQQERFGLTNPKNLTCSVSRIVLSGQPHPFNWKGFQCSSSKSKSKIISKSPHYGKVVSTIERKNETRSKLCSGELSLVS